MPEALGKIQRTEGPPRTAWLAGLYGLRLRQQGLTPDEAAQAVIRRYPSMRRYIGWLANRPTPRDEDERWRA